MKHRRDIRSGCDASTDTPAGPTVQRWRSLGLVAKTVDVAGGRILRDDSGEPTGVLIDNAMDLVERVPPQPSGKEIEAGDRPRQQGTSSRVADCGDMGIGPDAVAAYRRLAEQGRFCRCASMPTPKIRCPRNFSSFRTRWPTGPSWIAWRSDSGPGSKGLFTLRGSSCFGRSARITRRSAQRRAAVQRRSAKPRTALTSPDHIELMARWALVHGYQLATHAMSDRAVNLVLDAYRRAGVSASRNARFRIEHTQVVSDSDQPKAAPVAWGHRVRAAAACSQMMHRGRRSGSVPIGSSWPMRIGRCRFEGTPCRRFGLPRRRSRPRLALDAALWKTQTESRAAKPPADALRPGNPVRLLTSDAAYAAFCRRSARQNFGWHAFSRT